MEKFVNIIREIKATLWTGSSLKVLLCDIASISRERGFNWAPTFKLKHFGNKPH